MQERSKNTDERNYHYDSLVKLKPSSFGNINLETESLDVNC